MASRSVSRLLKLRGRRRIEAAMMRAIATGFDCTPMPVVVEAPVHQRWLSRDELHERIFKRIAELHIPLDKDLANGQSTK